MRSSATIVAETTRPGTTRCTTLRSSPPLALRETHDGLHLVASAAGPLGGDDLAVNVDVTAAARLVVRSVAAQLILPGPRGAPSTAALHATVGADADLRWLPSPSVLVEGADHRSTTTLALAATAAMQWREVIVLGRHDETSGSWHQRLRVDRAGRPLLRTDLLLGPRWPGAEGPAGTAGARVVGTALVVGHPVRSITAGPEVRAAAYPLADDAVMVTALGDAVEPVEALLNSFFGDS